MKHTTPTAWFFVVAFSVLPSLALRSAEQPATLADFAWLEGSWKGEILAGTVEEMYSAPRAGLMMGTMRLHNATDTLVIGSFTLRETGAGLEFCLRHFSPTMQAWEKEQPVVLKLAESDGKRSLFRNANNSQPVRLEITRQGDNEFHSAAFIEHDGRTDTHEVHLTRSTPPPPADEPVRDLVWLSGRWESQFSGNSVETIISKPQAGLLMGISRMGNATETIIVEPFTFVQGKDGVRAYLLTLSPAMGLTDEGIPLEMKEVESESGRLVLERKSPTGTIRRELLHQSDTEMLAKTRIEQNGTPQTMEMTLTRTAP